MSICLDLRQCPECANIWSFNPDVGHFRCPNCGSTELGQKIEANDLRIWLNNFSHKKNKIGVDMNEAKNRKF